MTLRTTKSTVTFENFFVLGDFKETFPPGTYEVETDEELLEGPSFSAYRRTKTLIYLPAEAGHPGSTRTLEIDYAALDDALRRDAGSGAAPNPRIAG
ncbi:hypothetical protein [Nisaea sediminum]|uniref:hypothetical protein n=1 Tax=Nisaea sediminum TaxID=2775867 RepID=UPI0018668AFB|nr:hypothetical protein [Nisaea sediminum]